LIKSGWLTFTNGGDLNPSIVHPSAEPWEGFRQIRRWRIWAKHCFTICTRKVEYITTK
jgi:hypothetical protein